jgi:hypothetical protein
MQLKTEVFPAPFGPITASSSLRFTSKDTPSIAWVPTEAQLDVVDLEQRLAQSLRSTDVPVSDSERILTPDTWSLLVPRSAGPGPASLRAPVMRASACVACSA